MGRDIARTVKELTRFQCTSWVLFLFLAAIALAGLISAIVIFTTYSKTPIKGDPGQDGTDGTNGLDGTPAPEVNGTDGTPLTLGSLGLGLGRVPSIVQFALTDNTPIQQCGFTSNRAFPLQNLQGPTPLFQQGEISNLYNFNLPPVSIVNGLTTTLGTLSTHIQINTTYLYGQLYGTFLFWSTNSSISGWASQTQPYVVRSVFIWDDIGTDFSYLYKQFLKETITSLTASVSPFVIGDDFTSINVNILIPHNPLRSHISIAIGYAVQIPIGSCVKMLDPNVPIGTSQLIMYT